MSEHIFKSAQLSRQCWSIILKFGKKIVTTESDCIGFRITSSIAVITGVV